MYYMIIGISYAVYDISNEDIIECTKMGQGHLGKLVLAIFCSTLRLGSMTLLKKHAVGGRALPAKGRSIFLSRCVIKEDGNRSSLGPLKYK